MLTIQGVDVLQPAEIEVIPDRIEAGTFLVAAAALEGEVTVDGIDPSQLTSVIDNLKKAGANLDVKSNNIIIKGGVPLNAVDVTTAVYPGYPTDMQAQWIALMSRANGNCTVTDTVYKDRFTHVPELARLGADVVLKDNAAIVKGVSKLKGAPVMSTDIRASASLIIAGLMAEGRTDIHRIYHIDRGYENIERKLRGIGADITREKGPEV